MLVGYILFGGSIFLTKATRWIKSQESDIIHAIDGKLILGKCLPKDWRSIRSEHGGKGRSEIKVINSLSQSRVIFCWIGFDGTLYHFRTINDCSIKDGSVPNSIVEYATIYHAFVCYHSSIESGNILKLDQLDPTVSLSFICSLYHS